MKKLAATIKALSDETRLRLMKLLEGGELCVCELMQVLDMSQPRISRHLGVLKNAGLVDDRREGKWVYYSLCNGTENEEVKVILKTVSIIGNDDPAVKRDKKNLQKAAGLRETLGTCAKNVV
jgi:DNA-binding transcriptional ArsR family regulator